MIVAIQRERALSLAFLGGGRRDNKQLLAQRALVDAALAKAREVWSDQGSEDPDQGAIQQASVALDSLVQGREAVDAGKVDLVNAARLYNQIIGVTHLAFSAFDDISNPEAAAETRSAVALARAAEFLAQEDAIIGGVLAAGGFTPAAYVELVQVIGIQRFQFAQVIPQLPASARTAYQKITSDAAYRVVVAAEDSVLSMKSPADHLPPEIAAWREAFPAVGLSISAFYAEQQARTVAAYDPLARTAIVKVAATGGIGLMAIVITILLSIHVGQSLIGRLARLRNEVIELAEHQLPTTVTRLRHGETVDVAAEVPQLDFGNDEIGEVGMAFNAVRHTAVASAVEEARMREGMSKVFLNIAHRSQSLLHRQLAALDAMERRTTKPTELQELFRIDHMAARMRRHAEDLVLLAGSAPTRRWRKPAPVIDLLRGAVSEVEGYERVRIDTTAEAAVHGRCVVDLVHLLAELIENATSFSPPHTPVRLTGQRVPNGYVIEVEDRGVGLAADVIATANQRLANPPAFDPANSTQLGLFVVSKLAKRHAIRVVLQPSPYGGLTAVVFLPSDLVVDPAAEAADAASGLVGQGSSEPSQATASGYQDDADDDLPRRVRQTNLSPHLMKATTEEDRSLIPRSPADVRSRMSRLQAGTLRGRAQASGDAGPGWNGATLGMPTQRRPDQAEGEDAS
jgi:signal transduction histidine kinase